MSAQAATDDLSSLLQRHAELESKFGDGDGGRFLSGWQCINPLADEIRRAVERESRAINPVQYISFAEDRVVQDELKRTHAMIDDVAPETVLCGSGSTSLIFTFCTWLRRQNIDEVYYIPPLYFTLHFALKLLNIRARAISGRHPFEPDFSFNLPAKTSVLLITDPIWYAGVPLSSDLIISLVEWQRKTRSLLFIDGSFQYAKWGGEPSEFSSAFDPAHTVRLICPTKALAAHGYRFSYVLLPEAMHQECTHIYANIYGSASVDSLAFARIVPAALQSRDIIMPLMLTVATRHRSLRSQGKISSAWEPSSGYFIFEKILVPLPEGTILMDGSFFEQKRYPEYRRINLLSPSLHLLG